MSDDSNFIRPQFFSDELLLKITQLSYYFRDRWLFCNFNAELYSGQIVTLRGANGCGKSTILRILRGLLPGYSGAIQVFGHQMSLQFMHSRMKNVGYLPQHLNKDQDFSVRFFLEMNGQSCYPKGDPFGIAQLWERKLQQLSGGEWSRVQLSVLWGRGDRLLLLDEPTAFLDDFYSGLLARMCINFIKKGGAILLATHDSDFVKLLPVAQEWRMVKDLLMVSHTNPTQ